MKTLPLGSFCQTGSGGTPNRSKANEYYLNGTIPWIKSGELSRSTVDSAEEFITELGLKESSAKYLEAGAILLAMYGATVGEVSRLRISASTNQAICHIYPDQDICDSDYLYRFLQGSKSHLLTQRVGGGQPNISQTIIRNLQIPLPPLAEQKRIAEILDAADALRTKRREAIALLNALLQSIFLDMFGDPVTNPMKRVTLKEVAPAQSAHLSFRPSDTVWQLYLDQIEPQSGRILKKVMDLVSEAGSSTHLFDTGNVLYSKLRPYLNKVVCPDAPGIATNELIPLRPDPNRLDRRYLTYYLRSQQFVRWVSNEVAGAKMPRVTMKVFWDHAIPLPPLDLQRTFSTVVEPVEHQKALYCAHLAELDTLFASLQQRAFNPSSAFCARRFQ